MTYREPPTTEPRRLHTERGVTLPKPSPGVSETITRGLPPPAPWILPVGLLLAALLVWALWWLP